MHIRIQQLLWLPVNHIVMLACCNILLSLSITGHIFLYILHSSYIQFKRERTTMPTPAICCSVYSSEQLKNPTNKYLWQLEKNKETMYVTYNASTITTTMWHTYLQSFHVVVWVCVFYFHFCLQWLSANRLC